MKNKTRFTTLIVLGLAIFILLGCQLASQATPVPAPDSGPDSPPTQEPPSTQALEPTPSQVQELDISSAVLTLDDLHPGFEEFSPEELGMSMEDFSDETFQPEEVFIFVNIQDFQMVFGFNFLLTSKLDRVAFDAGVSNPEITIPAFVSGMGSENVRDEKMLEGLEDIGEKQIGMTMVTDLEGVPAQVDVIMFRRDVVGAMLMSMVMEGESPNITIHELGLKLDQRIQESLQSTGN